MATRKQRKEQTRLRLMQAALDLFEERGVLATRTLDVARAGGVSHGTVFVHFPTRDDLVVAVIERTSKAIIEDIHARVEAGGGVRSVLEAHVLGLARHEVLYARLVAEGPALPSYARHTLLGIQAVISFHLGQAAARDREAGLVRDVPQHLLFNTWIGLVHHYLVNRDLFAPGQSVLSRCGADLVDHYMGLLAP